MIINLNKAEKDTQDSCDICIVGAGAAGISLALKLAEYGKSVILCEAGDKDFSEESQECYRGKNTGDYYYELDEARLRHLGGTTNHWGGTCRPLEEIDFQRHYMGETYVWPITKSDIDPYLPTAAGIIEISSNFKDQEINAHDIQEISFNYSPFVRMGEKYHDDLANNDKIRLYLNSNLRDIDLRSKQITKAHFTSYTQHKLAVKAKKYVFSMGGIENSRYLLWFHKLYGNKLYDNLPVGGYWMEHPTATIGHAFLAIDASEEHWVKHFRINPERQKQEAILSAGFRVHKHPYNYNKTKQMLNDLLCVAPKLGQKVFNMLNESLMCGVEFRSAWEQIPSPESKVVLSTTQKDKFGIPRPILNWYKNAQDHKTVRRSFELFNKWVMDNELGRFQTLDWIFKGFPYPKEEEIAGYHHIGGTRMHHDPKLGVVDANCKLHGFDNLYMAGSSIFTMGGHVNPTLSILQFSLRLADHLKA